jgi:hypothetical protein
MIAQDQSQSRRDGAHTLKIHYLFKKAISTTRIEADVRTFDEAATGVQAHRTTHKVNAKTLGDPCVWAREIVTAISPHATDYVDSGEVGRKTASTKAPAGPALCTSSTSIPKERWTLA